MSAGWVPETGITVFVCVVNLSLGGEKKMETLGRYLSLDFTNP